MICIQCRAKDTLDFCDKPACREANKTREDITQTHVPTHTFVKVRTVLNQTRDIGKLLRMSDSGLERARKLLDSSAEAEARSAASDNDGTELKTETKKVEGPREEADAAGTGADAKVTALTCVSCSSVVSYPCWYCIDCSGTSRWTLDTRVPADSITRRSRRACVRLRGLRREEWWGYRRRSSGHA